MPSLRAGAAEGRLLARPNPSPSTILAIQPGSTPLGIAAKRDGLIFVPVGYQGHQQWPLVLLLHGAGGRAREGLGLLQPLADEYGLILIAVAARSRTWDVIRDGYGPDVAFIDGALDYVFQHYAVDPAHLAIGGFSDGASYALSLGLANGDLFTHIIAFSPGFIARGQTVGRARIFISHGLHDDVLPIDMCSRRIVPRLQRAGYDVSYREFDGPHSVPDSIRREAVSWFTT